jgi:E3 Ubiquitin ligase
MISLLATLLANAGPASVAYLLGAAAGGYATVQGIRLSRTTRLSKTIAVAKLGKTALGPVEVSGIAAGPYTVTAPITGTICFGYRAVAWRRKTASNGHPDEIVAEEKLHVPFYLDDSTGKLLIDPTGAELDLRQDFRHEFRDATRSNDNPSLQHVRDFLKRHGVSDRANLRVEEFCIKPKSFLFIRGVLAKNPGLAVAPRALPDANPPTLKAVIGTLSAFAAEFPVPSLEKPEGLEAAGTASPPEKLIDLVSALSVADSSTQMTQQGKIAAALERAGIVMPDIRSLLREGNPETGAPENAVAEEAMAPVPDQGSAPSPVDGNETKSEFDLKPALVLMKDRSSSYVISWRDRRKAVSAMPRNGVLMLWGGPAITLLCLSLLAAQLGWL